MRSTCSRRQMLSLFAGAGVAMHARPTFGAMDAGLGATAAANGVVFGSAAGPVIDKDLAYRELYKIHTRIVTTDVALKMGTIAPRPGPKQYDSSDRLLQFCRQSKIPMR
jgi:endo-1,4-beta-xylanase